MKTIRSDLEDMLLVIQGEMKSTNRTRELQIAMTKGTAARPVYSTLMPAAVAPPIIPVSRPDRRSAGFPPGVRSVHPRT